MGEVLGELRMRREAVVERGEAGDAGGWVGEVAWGCGGEEGVEGGFEVVEGAAGVAPGAAVEEAGGACEWERWEQWIVESWE